MVGFDSTAFSFVSRTCIFVMKTYKRRQILEIFFIQKCQTTEYPMNMSKHMHTT